MALHQVAGHASSISMHPDPRASGSTLVKRASRREREFYTALGPSLSRDAFVGVWTAAFYGTLRLEGRLNSANAVEPIPASELLEHEMIVLENLTYRFLRPNVLDIKLGTQLHDDDATPEKRERMCKTSRETTSGVTGIRLTGSQVWDTTSQTYVKTDKAYGKSLAVEQLPAGFARFFGSPSGSHAGRAREEHTPGGQSWLPAELVEEVVRTLLHDLKELEETIRKLEFRMRGGSVLVIYEGDEATLRSSLERERHKAADARKKMIARRQARATQDVDGGAGISGSDEDSNNSTSTTDGEGAASPHTLKSFDVRLVDFAHTSAGVGPDEGVLLGLRSVRELVEQWLRGRTE